MSAGGVGRGRGWLNLKNQGAGSNSDPGNVGSVSPNSSLPQNFTPTDNKQFVDKQDDFSDLINKIKQLSLSDDGIKFNQKIKYIVESWFEDCQSANDVEKSFDEIHEACLADSELVSKFVLLVTSRTFLSQKIHEQNIRFMFVKKLQENFENSVQLQSKNPIAFRNSVQMIGEFFSKATFANGKKFSFMIIPLISCLEMLFESGQPQDLKLFTTQLYLNGSFLKTECPEKIAEILNKIRLNLCSEKISSKECKLWLLLALEIASNGFLMLPSDVYKFYYEQLGDSAMISFQRKTCILSVQTTHSSKILDSYKSNVNVLQVSSASDGTNDQQVNSSSTLSDINSSVNCSSSGFQTDSSQSSNVTQEIKEKQTKQNYGKTGRPILGVGSRLAKSKTNENSGDRRREKDSDWKNQSGQKKGGDWDKMKPPKANGKKGWEHDDRFDTDYS